MLKGGGEKARGKGKTVHAGTPSGVKISKVERKRNVETCEKKPKGRMEG